MSTAPPSYSTISLRDPPDYFIAVENRPTAPPPPYVDPTSSFGTSRPPATKLPPAPAQVHGVEHWIENWCAFIWILFLISLALLHLVLFAIYFKCPLPETSLGGIRALFFLHIISLVGMIIYCYRTCKRRGTFTASAGFLATFIYFHLPPWTSLVFFFSVIITDMTELNEAIRSSLTVTNAYPCSLSFYKLVFGVAITSYITIPASIIFMILCGCVLTSSRCKPYFNSMNTQGGPRNAQIQPGIQVERN
jgi:hypothetical protein